MTTPTRRRPKKRARDEEGDDDDDEEEFFVATRDGSSNIFETHVAPKLNGNDAKFFYDVNSESRRAIKRSGVRLADAFAIGDFETKSTISWALEKCSEERKERFCARMATEWKLGIASNFCAVKDVLGMKRYLFLCCQKRSLRVFEIRARKRMSLG